MTERRNTPRRRPRRMWGLFNFDIFWEAGRTRKDCREHAKRICGEEYEQFFRDKTLRIAKITVKEGW